jgi:transcriptional regulator of acetoin/glycerol metabolism
VVIAKGRMIGAEELKFLDPGRGHEVPSDTTLEDLEMHHIKAILISCAGNMSLAAKKLGINRSTLSRKMKRYRLTATQA